MSDLSRLLDDVYEPAAEDDGKGRTSDEALDDAFSGWVPGPSEDASHAERSLFAAAKAAPADTPSAVGNPTPVTGSISSDPPSDRFESAPDDAGGFDPRPGDELEPDLALAAWRPEDDDILPKRGPSRRLLSLNFSFRR